MVEAAKGGINAQIQEYLDQQRIGQLKTRKYPEAEIIEEEKLPYFVQSFATFQPVIEPLLKEINTKISALSELSPDQVQNRTFEPRVNEEYTQPGHFALIWRPYTKPLLASFAAQEDIDKFINTDEKLSSGKRISKRRREKLERMLSEYGNKKILLRGFNVIVVVADIANIDGVITPVVKLITNYTEEEDSGFTLEDLDFEKKALIPELATALEPFGFMYGKWPFYPTVRSYVTEGADKIMPTGPFV